MSAGGEERMPKCASTHAPPTVPQPMLISTRSSNWPQEGERFSAGWGVGMGELLLMGCGVSVWCAAEVLDAGAGEGGITLLVSFMPLHRILKNGHKGKFFVIGIWQ